MEEILSRLAALTREEWAIVGLAIALLIAGYFLYGMGGAPLELHRMKDKERMR